MQNDPTGKHSGSPPFLGIATFNLLPVKFSQPIPLWADQGTAPGDSGDPSVAGP